MAEWSVQCNVCGRVFKGHRLGTPPEDFAPNHARSASSFGQAVQVTVGGSVDIGCMELLGAMATRALGPTGAWAWISAGRHPLV
jgi:hypothetical protein